MLYASEVHPGYVSLIDSKTLERKQVSWEDVYNILFMGKKIHNITARFLPDDENSVLYESPEKIIWRYKKVDLGSLNIHGKLMKTLHLSYDIDVSADYSFESDDALVVKVNNKMCIWYKGDFKFIPRRLFFSCYLSDGSMMIDYEDSEYKLKHTAELKGTGSLSKADFKRSLLF